VIRTEIPVETNDRVNGADNDVGALREGVVWCVILTVGHEFNVLGLRRAAEVLRLDPYVYSFGHGEITGRLQPRELTQQANKE
jgi:hypothetical protein